MDWLKNRRPDLWSGKVRIDHGGPGGNPSNTEVEYRITPELEAELSRIAVISHRLEQEQRQGQEQEPR